MVMTYDHTVNSRIHSAKETIDNMSFILPFPVCHSKFTSKIQTELGVRWAVVNIPVFGDRQQAGGGVIGVDVDNRGCNTTVPPGQARGLQQF